MIGRGGPVSGLTTTPSYIATGARQAWSTGDAPAYGTNAAGDLFIMQVYVRETAPPSVPGGISGWTQIYGAAAVNNAHACYYRNARSTGSESGTVSTGFSYAGGIGVIHTFRSVATSSFLESSSSSEPGSNQTTLSAPTGTAGGIHRLAVCLIGRGDDVGTFADFTGESGGDWTSVYTDQTSLGVDSGIQMQLAALSSGGAISGGSYTDGLNELVTVGGFALVGI